MVQVLAGREIGYVDTDERGFEATPAGANAHIPSSRYRFIGLALASEEVISDVQALWRKDVDPAHK